jgi:hypothetical protein
MPREMNELQKRAIRIARLASDSEPIDVEFVHDGKKYTFPDALRIKATTKGDKFAIHLKGFEFATLTNGKMSEIDDIPSSEFDSAKVSKSKPKRTEEDVKKAIELLVAGGYTEEMAKALVKALPKPKVN